MIIKSTIFLGLLCALVGRAAQPTGGEIYKARCAMCHAQDGSAGTPMGQKLKIRDLRSPEVQKQTDNDFVNIITNGKPPMPAYGKLLSPADIRQIVIYLRGMQPRA